MSQATSPARSNGGSPSLARVEESFRDARRLQGEGRLDEARRIYEHILHHLPVHVESMTMLASVHYQQGDDIQAEAYLRRAVGVYRKILEQQPGALRARAPLANLLLAMGRRAEAEAELADLALPVNPIRQTAEQFAARRSAAIARGRGSLIINTVPKSASESIWNRLAEGLGLAQCYLSIGLYPECTLVPSRVAFAAQGGLIAKEHLPATPHNLELLRRHGLGRMVFHLRDPRQATLSWAHFVKDDVASRLLAPIWRQVVPDAEVLAAGLPAVIDWSIDVYLPRLIAFIEGWVEAADAADSGIEVAFLRFEDFVADGDGYLRRALEHFGIDPGDFAWDAAAENVHLRRGLTEEWREAFSRAQRERAWAALPKALRKRFGWAG